MATTERIEVKVELDNETKQLLREIRDALTKKPKEGNWVTEVLPRPVFSEADEQYLERVLGEYPID